MTRNIAALLAFMLAGPAFAADIPVRDFARWADFERVKLSPNGDYIAMTKLVDDHSAMAFIRLADGKPTGGLNFGPYSHVADFYWTGPDRVVASLAESRDIFYVPGLTGEMIGVDVDGKREKYLFGWRGGARSGTRIDAFDTIFNAWAWMIDPLPRDPDSALIAVLPWNKDASTHDVYRLNVYTGQRKKEFLPPADNIDDYLTDASGRVRYAAGFDAEQKFHSYVRKDDGTWAPVAQGDLAGKQVSPLYVSAKENAAWFSSNEGDGDRFCLVRQDLATGQRATVACDAQQSLAWTLGSQDHPIAAVFASGKPDMRVLAPDSDEGKVITTLLTTFQGKAIDDVSLSLDGTKLLVRAFSDRDPGSYFLLDTQAGKLKRLLAARPWIKPEQMAERRPIAFKARDGRVIHGYLTLPNGVEAKGLPLVVNPHGGPFGIRDEWEWDPVPQLLASRGYAVLQVNYRGSSGYGLAHRNAGKLNWGEGMINDITDGLRYVTAQGIADPARTCIYGASYGGYAAMMSAVREPDAYRCVVAYAGVYDLASMERDTDIGESWSGANYLREFVGMSAEIRKRQSPLSHIDKLKAPVFIVHGEEDKRAPFAQAKMLRSALEDHKIPYEWLSKPREEHGFYKEENRIEFYEKMLVFLDKYIGKSAAPAPAAAAK